MTPLLLLKPSSDSISSVMPLLHGAIFGQSDRQPNLPKSATKLTIWSEKIAVVQLVASLRRDRMGPDTSTVQPTTIFLTDTALLTMTL